MEGTDIRLEYQLKDENWVRPEIQIKLKNKSSRILYCALLGLTEDFEINTQFFPTGSQRLKPGEEAFANDNEPIPLRVPKELWDQGIIEVRDILKLIICTSDFDARLIAQPPLAQPQPNPEAFKSDEEKAARAVTRGGPVRRESALDRLLSQVHTRTFDLGAARDLGDWRTADLTFTTVRPRDTVAVPGAGESTALGPGVRLEGHPALAGAKARLSSITASSRDLGGLALPPIARGRSLGFPTLHACHGHDPERRPRPKRPGTGGRGRPRRRHPRGPAPPTGPPEVGRGRARIAGGL